MASLVQSPLESALRLLAKRDYSREEMRRKLAARGFPPEEIETALRELEAKNLLDDLRYARRLGLFLAGEKLLGAQQIRRRFIQKGIPADLAQTAMATAEETLPAYDRLQKVMKIKLKGKLPQEMSLKEKKKLVDTLRWKGFSWQEIQEALQSSGGLKEE